MAPSDHTMVLYCDGLDLVIVCIYAGTLVQGYHWVFRKWDGHEVVIHTIT